MAVGGAVLFHMAGRRHFGVIFLRLAKNALDVELLVTRGAIKIRLLTGVRSQVMV